MSKTLILANDMLEQREKPLNYGDISAQEVAERLLACWNKHINESIEVIQGGGMMVNPDEAPEGYMAVQYAGSCYNCAFNSLESCEVEGVSCTSFRRDDGESVYFIPKKEQEEMSHAENTQHVPSVIPGISLRDYFAGCAISGCMNASEEVYKVPERAYIVADMMLKEREKTSNGGDNATAN